MYECICVHPLYVWKQGNNLLSPIETLVKSLFFITQLLAVLSMEEVMNGRYIEDREMS